MRISVFLLLTVVAALLALVPVLAQDVTVGGNYTKPAPATRTANGTVLVNPPVINLPARFPNLEAYRNEARDYKPTLGLWIAIGAPQWNFRDRDFLNYNLDQEDWSSLDHRFALHDLPATVGNWNVALILRAPYPLPPGRIHTKVWSSLPEHLKLSMKWWRQYQADTGIEVYWYVGSNSKYEGPPTLQELEEELLPVVAAGNIRTFIIDALQETPEFVEPYAEFCRLYDVDIMIEPFPVHPEDSIAERETIRGIPTFSLNLRWNSMLSRFENGYIPEPTEEEKIWVVTIKDLPPLFSPEREEYLQGYIDVQLHTYVDNPVIYILDFTPGMQKYFGTVDSD